MKTKPINRTIFQRAAMTLLLALMTTATAWAQGYDISQCTVSNFPRVILHDLWHSGGDQYKYNAYRHFVVTSPDGNTELTRGTDYTVQVELSNDTRVDPYSYPSPFYYNDNFTKPEEETTWKKTVLNEKLIITGKSPSTGELVIPYRKFFLEWEDLRTYSGNTARMYTYIIRTADEFDLLAEAVNGGLNLEPTGVEGGEGYKTYGFILGADLDYTNRPLKFDNDGDGTPESNFVPIGTAEHPFNGILRCHDNIYHHIYVTYPDDIQPDERYSGTTSELAWHSIRGIRCTTKNAPAGLFGNNAGTVLDVTLKDCQFSATGTGAVGGIAALNSGTVERCLVSGTTVSGITTGAIVCTNSGTIDRNYYTGCTVGGPAYADNIGTGEGDVAGARRDVGLTIPVSLALAEGTTNGLTTGDGDFYGGVGETLTFDELTDDAYTVTGPATLTPGDGFTYTLAINADASSEITVTPANHFGTTDGADGSVEHPYIITTPEGLEHLARLVNSDDTDDKTARYKFCGKYFRLGNDINYDPDVLTVDLDNDGFNDSNHTPIGDCYIDNMGDPIPQSVFLGTFDGCGHTISGIRINNPNGSLMGIFGNLGKGIYSDFGGYIGTVENLTVSNTSITGKAYLGGIVGYFDGSAITNCHATNSVTISSCGNSCGGIVGGAERGTISYCTSSATINSADGDQCGLGGIAGEIYPIRSILSHNTVIGAIVGASGNHACGAIVGNALLKSTLRDYTFYHNYYSNCTVAGSNATGQGYNYQEKISGNYTFIAGDITTNDGIVPATILQDSGTDNSGTINSASGVQQDFTLFDRQLYLDGDWNTLCLPFAVGDANAEDGHHFDDTPLEGATVMEMDGTTSNLTDGTLTLNFVPVNSIEAGKPYIVKWTPALTIKTDDDWTTFAANVSGGESYAGKVVRLEGDINVSTPVGTEEHPFSGTFDGNGHTLTLSISDADVAAPFSYISGATILSVKSKGTVSGTSIESGLVGITVSGSTNYITACEVALSEGSHIVGNGKNANNIVNDCLYGISGYNADNGCMYGNCEENGWHSLLNSLAVDVKRFGRQNVILLAGTGSGNKNVANCYYQNLKNNDNWYTDATDWSNAGLTYALGDGWQVSGGRVVPKKVNASIESPRFSGVTVTATEPIPVEFTGGKFVGNYDDFAIDAGNIDKIIYLGSENVIGYASAARTLRPFRAHFVVPTTSGARAMTRTVVNFGDGETTGIDASHLMDNGKWTMDNKAGAGWYSLDGRRLEGKPSAKGVYISNGRKVVIN